MGRSRYKIINDKFPHFITCSVVNFLPVFGIPECAHIILESIAFAQNNRDVDCYAYVIMEDHIHLLLQGKDLAKCMRRFKSYTARKIIDHLKLNHRRRYLDMLKWAKKEHKRDAQYQLWTHGYHPVELDSDKKILNAIDYIHDNPMERGYVDRPEDWRYSSARNYSLRPDSLIDVTLFGSG